MNTDLKFSELLEAIRLDSKGFVETPNQPHPLRCRPVGVDMFLGWVIPNSETLSSGGIVIPESTQYRAHACVPVAVSPTRTCTPSGDAFFPWLDDAARMIARDECPFPVVYLPHSGTEYERAGHRWVHLEAKRVLQLFDMRDLHLVLNFKTEAPQG